MARVILRSFKAHSYSYATKRIDKNAPSGGVPGRFKKGFSKIIGKPGNSSVGQGSDPTLGGGIGGEVVSDCR